MSKQLLFADLAPLIGADAKPGQAASESPVKQPVNKALPVAPFRTERWDEIDADVTSPATRIVRDEELPITDLKTHLKLTDGVLLLDPLNFGVAGGNLVSTVRLDGKREPMGAMVDMTARHLKLKQLFPKAESMRASIGEVNGSAKLSGTGQLGGGADGLVERRGQAAGGKRHGQQVHPGGHRPERGQRGDFQAVRRQTRTDQLRRERFRGQGRHRPRPAPSCSTRRMP